MLSAKNICSSVTSATSSASGLQAPQQYPEGLTPGARSDVRPTAADPKEVDAKIMRLAGHGIYSFPVNITVDPSGKKVTKFPVHWKQLTTVEKWKSKIEGVLMSSKSSNGLAVMTEPSNLYCVDVDVASRVTNGKMKRSGIEIWEKLISRHGEPQTLKVITGSGGFHYYFDVTSTVGLNQSNDFAGLVVDGIKYGVDGRGTGGLLYAPPARYLGKDGESRGYSWARGGDGIPHAMPSWLVDTINRGRSSGATGHSIAVLDGARLPSAVASGCKIENTNEPAEPAETVAADAPFPQDGLLVRELRKMLKEKVNDSSSTYGNSLPHGLYGTYYCFRTNGPRKCFFGIEHQGSNNFNLLKRGRNVYYRCHGDDCSHEPVRKLGQLSLEAALEDATSDPVDQYDDMHVIMRHIKGSQEIRNLLLQILLANAVPGAFANLGKLFAYLYMIEGRILTTVHEAEKSQKGAAVFYVWNGSSWIQDTFNLVSNVITSQMGILMAWYEMKRDDHERKLLSEHPVLAPFWNQETREVDLNSVPEKRKPMIKSAMKSCIDQSERDMPPFKINVQDPVQVAKCLHSTITELFVAQLTDKFDQDPCVANAPNGLIDLKTGQLLRHHPKDLCNNQTFTYVRGASRAPTAKFRGFMISVLDESIIEWVQMFFGYCLLGETIKELLAILNGCGGNGKTQLKIALQKAFGTYCTTGAKAIFIKPAFSQSASAASSHLMHIKAARLVIMDESEQEEHLNCGSLKELTGGGGINARQLFCKTENYVPRFKLCMLTNYRPLFPANDEGMIRRRLLMMFNKLFRSEDQIDANNPLHRLIDTNLKNYMESDKGAADTLDFCVEGAMMYYARKAAIPSAPALKPIPQIFSAAINEYTTENDQLGAFISDFCKLGNQHKITKVEFTAAYVAFLMSLGHDRALANDGILTQALKAKTIYQHPFAGVNRMIPIADGSGRRSTGFFGIRLKTPPKLREDEDGNSEPSVVESCMIKLPGT
jgi:P4 family phage/plasmid primase-like protien